MTREEREEAIAILEEVRVIDDSMFQFNSAYLKALDMAIEALKVEPCEDAVSREAVLRINELHHGQMSNRINHQIWEEIKALPSVQPTQPCGDCVSREAALEAMRDLPHEYKTKEQRARTGGIAACQLIVEELPSVTPETPVAHWVAVDDEPHEWYECDHCGYFFTTKSANIMPEEENKYCPHCGRKMEEGEQE